MTGFSPSTGYNEPDKLESRIEFYQKYGKRIREKGWYPWVADKIDLSKTDRVLEIGCGSGSLWKEGNWGSVSAEQVVLSDISDIMVQESQTKLRNTFPKFQFMCLDSHKIPFSTGSFDVVIANHVLHLVEDLDSSISEIQRVLTEKGTLYATTKYRHNFGGIDNIIKSIGVEKRLNNVEQFGGNEAGRRLSNSFSTVKEDIYKEVYNISAAEIDALTCFIDSKIGLNDKEKKKLRRKLHYQIKEKQEAEDTHYSFPIEKYMGLLTAQNEDRNQ